MGNISTHFVSSSAPHCGDSTREELTCWGLAMKACINYLYLQAKTDSKEYEENSDPCTLPFSTSVDQLNEIDKTHNPHWKDRVEPHPLWTSTAVYDSQTVIPTWMQCTCETLQKNHNGYQDVDYMPDLHTKSTVTLDNKINGMLIASETHYKTRYVDLCKE